MFVNNISWIFILVLMTLVCNNRLSAVIFVMIDWRAPLIRLNALERKFTWLECPALVAWLTALPDSTVKVMAASNGLLVLLLKVFVVSYDLKHHRLWCLRVLICNLMWLFIGLLHLDKVAYHCTVQIYVQRMMQPFILGNLINPFTCRIVRARTLWLYNDVFILNWCLSE